MTKKQKKQLAQKIASLERIVQKNEDPIKVDEAKSQIMKISESSDMDYDEMVEIDEMVYKILLKYAEAIILNFYLVKYLYQLNHLIFFYYLK